MHLTAVLVKIVAGNGAVFLGIFQFIAPKLSIHYACCSPPRY